MPFLIAGMGIIGAFFSGAAQSLAELPAAAHPGEHEAPP
jgi:hypothetical protein